SVGRKITSRSQILNDTLILPAKGLPSGDLVVFWCLLDVDTGAIFAKTDVEREMTLKTTKLRNAIALALAVSATSVAGVGTAFAQDAAPAQDPTTLDRIEVTGSRLSRADIEGAMPVVVIDRAE